MSRSYLVQEKMKYDNFTVVETKKKKLQQYYFRITVNVKYTQHESSTGYDT